MNGLIINKFKHNYFTNMSGIFNLLPKEELDKNWLISDYVHTSEENKIIPYYGEYVFLTDMS